MVLRRLAPLVTVLALLGTVAVAPTSQAAPGAAAIDTGSAESEFVSRINSLRTSRGLSALQVDGQLTGLARSWAGTMAGQGRIFHAGDLSAGVTADWQKLGENVGVGGEVPSLFDAFVASPTHLANLVDPAFTHVGVGVVVSGGRIFTTHRFMGLRAAPPPEPEPAPAPTAAPTTAPATTAPPVTTPPVTTPPVTTPPTTAPTTTVPPTTAPPEPEPRQGRLGAIHRIPELLRTGDSGQR